MRLILRVTVLMLFAPLAAAVPLSSTPVPTARASLSAPAVPREGTNVRALVWIPEARVPIRAWDIALRAPVLHTRFDCRGDRCDSLAPGNPGVEVARRFEAYGFELRAAGRLHIPFGWLDVDQGRPARDVVALAPELAGDVDPDTLPLVFELHGHRRPRSWFAFEGRALLAALLPATEDLVGGAVLSLRSDAHFFIAGEAPHGVSVFARAYTSASLIEPVSGMFVPSLGGRFHLGSAMHPRIGVELATRLYTFHTDERLPSRFSPGFEAAISMGLPPL